MKTKWVKWNPTDELCCGQIAFLPHIELFYSYDPNEPKKKTWMLGVGWLTRCLEVWWGHNLENLV